MVDPTWLAGAGLRFDICRLAKNSGRVWFTSLLVAVMSQQLFLAQWNNSLMSETEKKAWRFRHQNRRLFHPARRGRAAF
jgi:hypothetical protein